MKKIINNMFMFAFVTQVVFSTFSVAQAQSYDDLGDSGFGAQISVDSGSGYSYSNFDPHTSITYSDLSNTGFSSPATYTGAASCYGCNSSVTTNSGYSYSNFDPHTSITYSDLSNTGFSSPATYTGTVNCNGCNSTVGTYTAPVYTGSNSGSYVAPVYAGYNSGSYVAPVYTGSNSGSYVAPIYTGYNTTSYVPGTVTTITGTNSTICSDGSYPINGSCNRVTTITGTNSTICSDGYALVNGSCNRITTISGTNSVICSDGSHPINGSCNRVTTISGTNSTICSDGNFPVNGSCNRVTTITTTNNTICSDGLFPVNGSCVRNNTIQTVVNTICSDGNAPTNGSCVRNNTIPTFTNTICSDGSYPTNGSCVRTNVLPISYRQTCWDGSTIPTGSVCPAQYKYCANGTSVPVTQACYVPPTQVYIPPQVVKFNNVVTSPVTQITNTSGRCNGIGLVANNAPSTGWFEYGETSSLGRTTATANIGSSNTAPFSNILASLKPSTKYYCRAVMQNQYGLVKGEIVGFVTKAVVIKYVKPIVITHTTKTPTKAPPKTTTVTCSDGSTVPVKNASARTLLNQGDKLVSLQVEKIDGKLTSGEVVHYKISYKNLADIKVSGLLIKVTLPQEIIFASANAGNYDPGTRTLTLNQDTLDPYTEGIIMITGNVQNDAPVGKTIVTNVYAMYTVPGTQTQDELSAYVVGSIMPNTIIANQDTGAKKVIGISSDRGFMPNSLIEWLALLAILFIIFILGRSVYASYKDDEGHNKH